MERIWRLGRPIVVREIFEQLKTEHEIAYTTVMTAMDALYRKGWLRRERCGRAYAYEAVLWREAYAARLMLDALATSDNQAATFVHFLEQLSESEARAARTALQICPPTEWTATDPDPR